MKLLRRQIPAWIAAGAIGQGTGVPAQTGAAPTQSHIGNLYPFVQKQADRSTLELSFLRQEFSALKPWQEKARALVLDHLFYQPLPVQPDAQMIRRTERADYIEEYLTFQTTPDIRVPAFVLDPEKGRAPYAGIVALTITAVSTTGEKKSCSSSRMSIRNSPHFAVSTTADAAHRSSW